MGDNPMEKLGLGDIYFYRDRIEVKVGDNDFNLGHREITSLSAQYMERIELFHENNAFRFVSKTHFESGLKWELAENVIWQITGEDYKVAAYFSELVQ